MLKSRVASSLDCSADEEYLLSFPGQMSLEVTKSRYKENCRKIFEWATFFRTLYI